MNILEITFFLLGFLLSLFVFSLINFKFITMLILVENINVLLLFLSYQVSQSMFNIPFIIFMVVATMEVTLSLVSLTRVWDSDCLYY